MIPTFEYKVPRTLTEACDLLWQYGDRAKVIAGGTDLVISLRNGLIKPELLIDITHLPELRRIEERNDSVSIGGSVTHSEIVSSLIVQTYGRILSEASSQVGSPQIRNLGTLGGNIVNASPAADTVPPLMVLEAKAKILSKEGEKEIPVSSLFRGPYQSALQPHEILVSISFKKLGQDMKGSLIRLARREGMAISRMSIAVILQKKGDLIEDIRISIGAVTPIPNRMKEAESLLKHQRYDTDLLKMASEKVSSEMILQTGIRASTPYKKPVVEALVERAIRRAFGDTQ